MLLALITALGATAGSAQADHFALVGTHPQAAAQPTARGRTLNFLRAWNGSIYAGYGDYGVNTGPIAINPFDLATETFSAAPFFADSEELDIFRALNGELYAPSIDTRSGGDYSQTSLSGWTGRDVVASDHVFDMATLTGGDLWMVGSAGSNAVAWRSIDGGATWSEGLSVAPMHPYDFARFYFAGVYDTKLYVQAVDFFAGTQPTSWVFDGSTWSTGPDLLDRAWFNGRDPEDFAGRMVYLGTGGRLAVFDGSTVRLSSPPFYNFTIDGATLYGLGARGQIWTTDDLTNWTSLKTRAPKTARSIVVAGGVVYVGTTTSSLYKLEPSAANGPSVVDTGALEPDPAPLDTDPTAPGSLPATAARTRRRVHRSRCRAHAARPVKRRSAQCSNAKPKPRPDPYRRGM